MPRSRKTTEEAFFLNNRKQVQYNETCMNCQKECKQSFRATVIACRRWEPIEKKKRKEKE